MIHEFSPRSALNHLSCAACAQILGWTSDIYKLCMCWVWILVALSQLWIISIRCFLGEQSGHAVQCSVTKFTQHLGVWVCPQLGAVLSILAGIPDWTSSLSEDDDKLWDPCAITVSALHITDLSAVGNGARVGEAPHYPDKIHTIHLHHDKLTNKLQTPGKATQI